MRVSMLDYFQGNHVILIASLNIFKDYFSLFAFPFVKNKKQKISHNVFCVCVFEI